MKIPKELLTKIFSLSSYVTSSRERDELLYKGVHVNAKDGEVQFSANGNFNALVYKMPESEAETLGDVADMDAVIELGKTLNVLSKSSKEIVSLSVSDKRDDMVLLKAEGSNMLRFVPSSYLSPLPTLEESTHIGNMPLGSLLNIIDLSSKFVSDEINKTQIIGICFADGKVYGADETKCIYIEQSDDKFFNTDQDVILNSEIKNILKAILQYDDGPNDVDVYLSNNNTYVIFDLISDSGWGAILYAKRFEVEYPKSHLDRANEIVMRSTKSVTVETEKVLDVLSRIGVFVDSFDMLFITVSGKSKVTFSVRNYKTDERSDETIPCATDNIEDGFTVSLSYNTFLTIARIYESWGEPNFTFFVSEDSEKIKTVSFNDMDADGILMWQMQNIASLED